MSPAVTMAGAITALVTEKRATGYKYDAEERVLARFAAFCASQFPGLEAPDRASVEAWIAAARQRGVKPATLHGLAAGDDAGGLPGADRRPVSRTARGRGPADRAAQGGCDSSVAAGLRGRRLREVSCPAFPGQGILRIFTRLPAFPAVRP